MQLKTQLGFSLLEIAIALLIIGLLIQTASSGLSQQHQLTKYKTTENQLASIKSALLGHLTTNHYLPCPDTNGNGRENRKANGACQAHQGQLPYLELGGIGHQDEFNQPFFYAINTHATSNTQANNHRLTCRSASLFANSGQIENTLYYCEDDQRYHCLESQCGHYCNTLCQQRTLERNQPPYFSDITPPLGTSSALNGALRLCGPLASSCNNTTALSRLIANQIPAIVISFGENGAQTWQNCQSAQNREQQNCNGDRYFQLDPYSDQFDDQMIWLTMHEIKALTTNQIYWHQH